MSAPPWTPPQPIWAEVEALVKAAGTSFYRGMRVLPPDRRAAMYAVYAFCRLVDDVADEPAPIEDKRAGLADWREAIAGVFRGSAANAVTRVPGDRRPAVRPAAGGFPGGHRRDADGCGDGDRRA